MWKDKRLTLVFPGQGSQYTGMGKDLYNHFGCVREVYEEASQVLGYDLADMCFREQPAGKGAMRGKALDKTIYTQPAVFATSYACFRAFEAACREKKMSLTVASLAGHSLGEYTALVVSGAIDFKTCLCLVNKRAAYMSQVGNGSGEAGLMAILSRNGELDQIQIDALCRAYGVHVTVNNTRRQIVVGGLKTGLREMARRLKKGVFTAMLKVEGPFHTPMMKRAATKFKKELGKIPIRIADKPVVANVSKRAIVDPEHIRTELYEQIFQVVDWRGSMEKIIGEGGKRFIEVGPKRVLTRMFQDIDPSVISLNVEDTKSLRETLTQLADRN